MQNTIISASAGSGKTFQLSNRYIDLVCRNVPVEKILASTFTRKAAGEILDRIMTRLADDFPKKREELRQFIPSVPSSETKLKSIVAELARNLYKVRISTLDSFFNKIAAAFSLELGLPVGWKMIEEDDFARNLTAAVRSVLQKQKQNNVRKLIADFQKGESKRSITPQLVSLAKEYLALFNETELKHWQHRNLLRKPLTAEELGGIMRQLPQAGLRLDGKPNKNFDKLIAKWLDWKSAEDWKAIIEKVSELKEKNYTYYNAEFADCVPIEQLGEHAAAVELNKLVGQTEAAYELLKLITEAYQEISYQNGLFRFEDITQKLRAADRVAGFSGESLNHRLNAPANHLLLDEFQDTSKPQWDVLKPFSDKADSRKNRDGSVFVVGDRKQAIYGWRGGVAEIFDIVQEELDPEKQPLDTSFRSSPVIIETVNKLFGNIAQNAALLSKSGKYAQAAAEWSEQFSEHSTAKKLDGFVSLEIAPEEEKTESEENAEESAGNVPDPFSDYVAKRIQELHSEKPAAQIGVLTVSNDAVGKIIAALKNLGIEASEEGGVPLTNSVAVQIVLSAMKIADHPGDTTARFHLVHSPLGKKLNLTGDVLSAAPCSVNIRKMLITNGYGKTVQSYVPALSEFCDDREYERLQKVVELAYQFDSEASGVRTQNFIKRIETARVESPSAANIRVMTVHKSKGLEFDIVVLPELKQPLVKNPPPPYTVARKSPAQPVDWVLKHADKGIQAFLPPEYQKAFSIRIKNETIERLCVLYVAMTRAKQELLMIVPAKSKPEQNSFAGVLLSGLGGNYQHGNKNWQLPQEQTAALPASVPRLLNCTLKKTTQPKLIPESPSGLERYVKEPKTSDAVPGSLSRKDAQLRGTAIHRCFESIKWLDEAEPNPAEFRELVQKEIRGKTELRPEKIVEEFLQFCGQTNVKKILSRSSYPADEEITVEQERHFAVRDLKEKKLLHGSVDRLVVRRKNGKIVGLDIIDYKTGSTGSSVYTEQMNAYKRAMELLYKINGTSIKTSMVFVEADKIE